MVQTRYSLLPIPYHDMWWMIFHFFTVMWVLLGQNTIFYNRELWYMTHSSLKMILHLFGTVQNSGSILPHVSCWQSKSSPDSSLTNIGQYKNSLRSTFRCILIVVRGSPNSASSFLIDIFGDLIFALSISWYRIPLNCRLLVVGLSFTLTIWKSFCYHFKSVCFRGGSFLRSCWKSFRPCIIDFPV